MLFFKYIGHWLDLENKLSEGEYDKLLSLLTKDFPINEKRDIQLEILQLL